MPLLSPLLGARRLYLASASPRRLELLRQAGVEPAIIASLFSEEPWDGAEPFGSYAVRQAEGKAGAVFLAPAEPAVILAADTVVVHGGRLFGKPQSPEEAQEMLTALNGAVHTVITGMALRLLPEERTASLSVSTRVRMRKTPPSILERYVAGGEPLDKAGAYGIQGEGALLIQSIEGSYSNVVGLPLEVLPDLLAEVLKSP